MQFLNRASGTVQDRLTKLFGPRMPTDVTKIPSESEGEIKRQILLNPPTAALRPIVRSFGLVVMVLLGVWWLNKPTEISKIENLTNLQVAESESQLSQIVVHVTGDVLNPGVVTLPVGSRVIDAITAAGGFSKQIIQANLNLAAHVEDGQLIYVGQESSLTTDTRLNLNTATASELEDLPGVGPVMAERILKWRTTNNRFSSIEELQEIEGIGPKLFSRLRELVRV